MGRDRASVRIDMWADHDWRSLSFAAQHLYMQLLSHPTLSYAGVAEWRPGRLAAVSADLTRTRVEESGKELTDRFFVVIDEDTEEVLIRSFVKHDGLMKQPKLVVSMTTAYAAVGSSLIREVLAYEVQKLHEREPSLNAWKVRQVETILKAPATDAHTLGPTVTPLFTLAVIPGLTPAVTPNAGQELGVRTTTATTTTTDASHLPGKTRETPLPKDWSPTSEHIKRAKERGIDVIDEADNFRLHAETHDRRASNWNAAFTAWLKKSKPNSKITPATDANAWMARSEIPAWQRPPEERTS